MNPSSGLARQSLAVERYEGEEELIGKLCAQAGIRILSDRGIPEEHTSSRQSRTGLSVVRSPPVPAFRSEVERQV